MSADSPCDSPVKIQPAETSVCTSQSTTPIRRDNLLTVNRPLRGITNYPSPGHVSDTELQVLQTCLRRWRTEVEHDVKGYCFKV